jgi:hypothetical protein
MAGLVDTITGVAWHRCELCDGEILTPPRRDSNVRWLRGEQGWLIIADMEYTLHKCPGFTKQEATELLRLSDLDIPDECDF